jgi:predicted HAD superfamily Cof-like phosphohydrolase
MLVGLPDTKGRMHYINAVYVKSVQPKGNDSAVEISGRSTKLRVRMPAEDIVELLNAAMPSNIEAMLAVEDQIQADQAAAAAAAAAG